MDGNGANDLLASSQDARGGAVYLLLLNADGTTKSSQMIASGIGGAPTLPPGEFFGMQFESIRDFDRDGFADLAISSQGGGGTDLLAVFNWSSILSLRRRAQLTLQRTRQSL